jgi:hypothetical protein
MHLSWSHGTVRILVIAVSLLNVVGCRGSTDQTIGLNYGMVLHQFWNSFPLVNKVISCGVVVHTFVTHNVRCSDDLWLLETIG